MTRIESLWQTIRQEAAGSRIPEGEFRLVRIDLTHAFEIYAGVDGTSSVMLAVGVSGRPPVIDADSGALNYIRAQRAGGNWIMALRLAGVGLEQVFGRLCQDLIDTAAHVPTETALVSLFRERLLLWKRLFRDGSSGLLQKFQIKGLIAELLALESFMIDYPEDPAVAVVSWIGSFGADQDFLFADHAVEIKAISPGAEKVSIASAAQLCAEVPLELHLYVLRDCTPTEPGAISLPVLVNRIEQRLAERPDALNAFRTRMMEAEYVEHDHYLGVSFTLMETRRYAVCDDFPRLVRSKLPDAIADVTYSIMLSSIAPFQIPENSDEV
ncbi:PD-(D/E)XK motif protein [Cupriavidus pauculus]|uniref:PD-(D/E)XK motif protein n=1 Tax=Cupriavidus pauculus TaxID=82633 RepID=UPI001EE362BB|nr:PD-(D/E)XK motif protein [Cupriavidus pauculus]GJG98559.1 PD-(D/E)XK motif protein [Cupriavidus pauculus]